MGEDAGSRVELPSGLADLVTRFRDAWERSDLPGLLVLWDTGHPEPTYVAEEVPGAMVGLEPIRAYWASVFARFRDIRVRLRPVACDLLGEYGWLVGQGGFHGVRLADGATVVTDGVRVGMLVRQTPEGWKVLHYMEAPCTPA